MPFTLYLVRHSKAHPTHPEGDRFRELSGEGLRRIEDLLPRLAHRQFNPELYLTSPYVRARQTCQLVHDFFGGKKNLVPPIEISASLVPEGDYEDLLAEVQGWGQGGYSSCALFTHNPFVTVLAEVLVRRSPDKGFTFHTPSIVALSFPGLPIKHQGELLWTEHREG